MRIRLFNKNLISAIVLAGTIGLTSCSEKPRYTNATVVEEKEIIVEKKKTQSGGLFGSPVAYNQKEITYNLHFKTDHGEVYVANIIKRQGQSPAYFSALKEAITNGARIRIKTDALNRFKGLSGLLVNDEIEFLASK